MTVIHYQAYNFCSNNVHDPWNDGLDAGTSTTGYMLLDNMASKIYAIPANLFLEYIRKLESF